MVPHVGIAAVAAFFGKAITSTEPLAVVDDASPGRKAAYILWPGMTPRQFFARGNVPAPPPGEWLEAAFKLATGAMMIVASVKLATPLGILAAGWIGMIGVVLALHFGLFHGLALVLRTAGIDARPIMNRPLLATSLSDFWGARWNRAFSEPAFRMICRPLAKRVGLPAATPWPHSSLRASCTNWSSPFRRVPPMASRRYTSPSKASPYCSSGARQGTPWVLAKDGADAHLPSR